MTSRVSALPRIQFELAGSYGALTALVLDGVLVTRNNTRPQLSYRFAD